MSIQDNTAYLQPNKLHRAGDKQPCLKGTANIEGVEYDVAVWAPKEGKKAYYAKFTRKNEDSQEQQATEPTNNQQQPAKQQYSPPPKVEKNPSGLFR